MQTIRNNVRSTNQCCSLMQQHSLRFLFIDTFDVTRAAEGCPALCSHSTPAGLRAPPRLVDFSTSATGHTPGFVSRKGGRAFFLPTLLVPRKRDGQPTRHIKTKKNQRNFKNKRAGAPCTRGLCEYQTSQTSQSTCAQSRHGTVSSHPGLPHRSLSGVPPCYTPSSASHSTCASFHSEHLPLPEGFLVRA